MPTVDTSTSAEVGAITQEKTTTRRYVKYGQVDDGQGNVTTTIVKSSILSDTEKKEPDNIKVDGKDVPNPYAGISTAWASAERDGYVLANENDVISYSVKSFEGAETLNPDPTIRLYIYNRGLATFQTSVANAFMKSTNENSVDPEFNGFTLDLRVGTDEEGNYSINKAPSRGRLTDEDKLVKLLKATGKTDAQIATILAVINASQQVAVEQESEQVIS